MSWAEIYVLARAEQAALGPIQHEVAEPKYRELLHEFSGAPPPSFRQRFRQGVVKTSAATVRMKTETWAPSTALGLKSRR